MSAAAGFVRLFRTPPPEAATADGRMALADHLRELRARLLRSVVVITLALVVALFFYDQLLDLVLAPYNDAKAALGGDVQTKAYIKGATGPLMLQLKLSGIAALVATSPYWLYQIWASIVPGLHPHERKWSRVFAAVAGPLFVLGVAVGYYVLPRGLEVLIGFTPSKLENLVEFGEYFTFFTRMLLRFGVAIELIARVIDRRRRRELGALSSPTGASLECDVLACDLAYPQAVLEEKWRAGAHHAWQLGETLLLEYDGRLTLVVPGTSVQVEHALEAVRRLAKAVAAPSSRFTVTIRL